MSPQPRQSISCLILASLLALQAACGLRGDSASTDAQPRSLPTVPAATHGPYFQTGFAYSRIGGSYDSDVSSHELEKMREAGGNTVQFLAFAYVDRLDAPQIDMEQERSDRILRGGIARARAVGLRTMVKLHMWGPEFRDGKFAADIGMRNDDDWRTFMANYRTYALRYARLAAESGADILCIGTELAQASRATVAADCWRALAAEVRTIYSGPLTYAAHHNEVERVPFWDSLDYIGVNGYYPVSQLPAALKSLESLSARWNRPVIFTESGFASSAYALREPWRPGPYEAPPDSVRLDLQAEGYEILLTELWRQKFIWGIYAWKWHPNSTWGGPTNGDHTPQGKPALEVIRRFYKNLPARAGNTATSMRKSDAHRR